MNFEIELESLPSIPSINSNCIFCLNIEFRSGTVFFMLFCLNQYFRERIYHNGVDPNKKLVEPNNIEKGKYLLKKSTVYVYVYSNSRRVQNDFFSPAEKGDVGTFDL